MRVVLLVFACVFKAWGQDPDPYPRGPNPLFGDNITDSMSQGARETMCRDCIVDPDGRGYVMDTADCGRYHQCAYVGAGNWHVFRMRCGFNTRFMESMVTCVHCEMTTCPGTPQASAAAGASCDAFVAPTTLPTTYTPPTDLAGVNCTGADTLQRQASNSDPARFYRGQDGRWRMLSCGNFEFDIGLCGCRAPSMWPIQMDFDVNFNSQPNNRIFGNGHDGCSIHEDDPALGTPMCRAGSGCLLNDGTGSVTYNLFKNLPLGGAITMSVWYRLNAEAGGRKHGIFSNGGCDKEPSIAAVLTDTNTIQVTIETSANGTREVSVSAPGAGQWVHFAMTYLSGTGLRVYVNGNEAGRIESLYGSLTHGRQSQHPLVLGRALYCERNRNPGGATTSFEGYMDNFFVDKSARSGNDILNNQAT